MNLDVQFLFDNQLIAELESLIRQAKHQLLLISPFIDLDKRIQDALGEKISRHDFQLRLLFGKNEHNHLKSIKPESMEFLKQFPDIEIKYNERLHAKFYQNDHDFILTSMNLYDYSLAKNIEVGIKSCYASKGLLGKAIDSTNFLVGQGVDKVKHEILGIGSGEMDPIDKFESIFQGSKLVYQTKPILEEQSGVMGFIGGKKLKGFNVIYDSLSANGQYSKPYADLTTARPLARSTAVGNLKSVSHLSKMLGVSASEITKRMEVLGLVSGDKITEKGVAKGIVIKSYMGKQYIAFPDNLPELVGLKK